MSDLPHAPVIYLAHPIDNGSLKTDVNDVRQALTTIGCVVYDPKQAWSSGGSPLIHDANMAVLERVDAMVLVLDPNVLTIGGVVEATSRGRDWPGSVFVYGPNLSDSVVVCSEGWTMTKNLQSLITRLATYLTEKGFTNG